MSLVLVGLVVKTPSRGRIKNESPRPLWVVETDSGRAIAHKLAPGHASPAHVDADGVRSIDGAPIRGHKSWWKVRDVSSGTVRATDGALDIRCLICSEVQDDEFGSVRFDDSNGWGEPL